jgi:hypothetical protein
MVNLKFDFPIVDLDGKEIEKSGKMVAAILMGEKQGDAVKYFDWALKVNKGEELSVDDSDFNKIKEIVTKTEVVFIIVKGQLLKYLQEVK